MRRLALLAMVIVLPACSGSTGAAPGSGANVAAVIAPSLDRSDQPSFANRTGRPPALSLQELFHPAYNVPVDPSKIRTDVFYLLVAGGSQAVTADRRGTSVFRRSKFTRPAGC